MCEDPDTNIWSYYGTIKLTPIVLDDYLMLILIVPLIDQSPHINLYKVHNLLMLHPTLHGHAQYEIEGSYLATVMDGMFITLPTALDVRLCLMTNGHLCMFNQALYCCGTQNFIGKNNQYFDLSSVYFLYPLASLPKMVNPEMPASIKQS